MIPQTNIEQAAKLYVAETVTQCINIDITQLREFCKLDFTAGVRFAESEMGQIAQEFAEWCDKKRCYTHNVDGVKLWRMVFYNEVVAGFTIQQLFAKFMAERTNPAPDIEG